jgi:hypothetical protein
VKDLNGYMKKAIWIFSILFFFSFFSPSKASAQTPLSTDAVFDHNIKANGIIETTITFTISSSQRTVLTYYTITIPQTDIDSQIRSVNRNKPLEATTYNRTDSTDILIDLENAIIQKDSPEKLTLSYIHKYSDKNIINLISKIADTTTSKVSITYPREWGDTSWISDQIDNLKQSDSSYILNITAPDSTAVKLIFGQDIVYRFNISRSFNNVRDSSNQYEIIIPQDSQFQKIIIEDINVRPTQALFDNSGNYILIYTLEPQEQIDIKISGYVIMEQHQYFPDSINFQYDRKDIYWSLEERQIEKIEEYFREKGLTDYSKKDILTEYIYNYVTEQLQPTTTATTLAGGVRRGASEVLKKPSEATAEDYADLLKTFLSYYEVPAIYTIGYVSDISSYQDSGMFHYWVQAFDGEKWMVLDPYLEDYSKVSLFAREQLDHISILNRSNNSISPILNYYSDNDIKFEYVKNSEIVYSPESNISISLEPYSVLNKYMYGKIVVENTGNSIFTNIELADSQPDLKNYLDSITNSADTILLPHMKNEIRFHIPFNKIEDEMIFTTVNLKNGTKIIDSELISTEYSISERTGYEVLIKFISIILFLVTFSIIYIITDKIIYKR